MKHPLQPASHSGAVLRRTRRVDGVKVNVHCARRLRALHTADADRSCPRDTDCTVRGCPRRPRTRRRRRRVACLPQRRSEPRRPSYGVLRGISPDEPGHVSDAVRIGPKSKKKPPTAIIPGDESPRRRECAANPPRAEIRREQVSMSFGGHALPGQRELYLALMHPTLG